MRIIAGSQKGRQLVTTKGLGTRPTSGRVREALFSIVSERVPGSVVLDLYAGTGALGLEALSRGADHVVFVESDPAALRSLSRNVQQCRVAAQVDIYTMDVRTFLRRGCSLTFSLVFADPPYAEDPGAMLLPSLSRSVMIRAQTLVILEHRATQDVPPHVGRLTRIRRYKYGDTSLSLYGISLEDPPS